MAEQYTGIMSVVGRYLPRKTQAGIHAAHVRYPAEHARLRPRLPDLSVISHFFTVIDSAVDGCLTKMKMRFHRSNCKQQKETRYADLALLGSSRNQKLIDRSADVVEVIFSDRRDQDPYGDYSCSSTQNVGTLFPIFPRSEEEVEWNLEPDPIAPWGQIRVVSTVDAVPISLKQDLSRILPFPGSDRPVSQGCAPQNHSSTPHYPKDLPPVVYSRSHQVEAVLAPLLFSFAEDSNSSERQTITETDVKSGSSIHSLRLSEMQQAKWLKRFEALRAYMLTHADCNVATTLIPDVSLALWVKRTRHQYKRYQRGQRSSLTPERVELLKSINFRWQVHDDSWCDRFAQLQAFARKHGHIRVPTKGSSTSGLHNWIKRQRRQYRMFAEGRVSKMSAERFQKLRDLGLFETVRNY
jgi:Helicase associated domain